MPAKRKWRIVFVGLAVVCMVSSLSAVIVEIREYHGKQVTCVHSGLRGVVRQCGTEGYARVFTGFVSSSVEVGETDKLLQLIPDEVFVGDSSDATVITNQACLNTDIQAGDKWLFYLYRDPSDKLILSYDGPSKPITKAEDDVPMLRDLGHLTDKGIIIGTIERSGDTEDAMPSPLAHHKVVAKNVKNGDEYLAYTSQEGHFTFELPVGRYDVTPAPEYGLQEVEGFLTMLKGSVPVEKQRCWEHDFDVKPAASVVPRNDATISGHLGSADGKPFTVHPWVQIVSVDSEAFTSAYVDTKGNFEAKGVKPGRYVVGLGIQPGTGVPEVKTPVYYPGVRTKEQATIIELRAGEKRSSIDFQLPIEDVVRPLGRAESNR